ncbi:MAG: hypothetical protein V4595_03700 [Pseudomonadota bacterium]
MHTPRWSDMTFDEQQIRRPQERFIAIAYQVEATRDGSTGYTAYCTTTMRRLERGSGASCSTRRQALAADRM